MWLIQLPLFLIPTQKLRYLFVAKLCITPIAALATMAWCVHTVGGAGPIFQQESTLMGSNMAWVFLSCASSISGSLSTLACNIPDLSRYSRSSRAKWVQLPFIPVIHLVGATIGVIGTSATCIIYGELVWNPLTIYLKWIDGGSSGGRAAAFFCSFAWALYQICTNITANSISAANDLTVLFPKYINIKRGCIVASIIRAWAFVPWRIVAAAANLQTFPSGYSIFLAPTAGILCTDYWIVRNRKIDIPALYDPYGRYRYWYGINWRDMLAFSVLLCLHSLISSIRSLVILETILFTFQMELSICTPLIGSTDSLPACFFMSLPVISFPKAAR
jgi:nucleobase:cation symporter-1, NCS1 family